MTREQRITAVRKQLRASAKECLRIRPEHMPAVLRHYILLQIGHRLDELESAK